MKNQKRMHQNWSHDWNRGVPREGRALLQGIVCCGVCGRKMSVQNSAVKENRPPSYICGRGYQHGDEKVCQSMTSRPVDAAAVAACARKSHDLAARSCTCRTRSGVVGTCRSGNTRTTSIKCFAVTIRTTALQGTSGHCNGSIEPWRVTGGKC